MGGSHDTPVAVGVRCDPMARARRARGRPRTLVAGLLIDRGKQLRFCPDSRLASLTSFRCPGTPNFIREIGGDDFGDHPEEYPAPNRERYRSQR